MIVWTVFLYDHESSRILGVFSSEHLAEEAVVALDVLEPYQAWSVNSQITPWEVI